MGRGDDRDLLALVGQFILLIGALATAITFFAKIENSGMTKQRLAILLCSMGVLALMLFVMLRS